MSTEKLSESHEVNTLLDEAEGCNELNERNISHTNDPMISRHLNCAQGRYMVLIRKELHSPDGEPKVINHEPEKDKEEK